MIGYSEPLFRPPSEADSLIVQITEGCSYNRCTFCPAYKSKTYREKDTQEIQAHLESIAGYNEPHPKRAFLADGDALGMPVDKVAESIRVIKNKYPGINRFTIYGSVYSLLSKSVSDLQRLREEGLQIVYLGIESGDEATLRRVNKYLSFEQMVESCGKVTAAGLTLSVMLLTGLAGKSGSTPHAEHSAAMINRIQPNYTSLLNLITDHTPLHNDPDYQAFSLEDYVNEVKILVERISCRTILRSNHASNYLSLRGTLPKDRQRLLDEIEAFSRTISLSLGEVQTWRRSL